MGCIIDLGYQWCASSETSGACEMPEDCMGGDTTMTSTTMTTTETTETTVEDTGEDYDTSTTNPSDIDFDTERVLYRNGYSHNFPSEAAHASSSAITPASGNFYAKNPRYYPYVDYSRHPNGNGHASVVHQCGIGSTSGTYNYVCSVGYYCSPALLARCNDYYGQSHAFPSSYGHVYDGRYAPGGKYYKGANIPSTPGAQDRLVLP